MGEAHEDTTATRPDGVPNANSPQLLTHLLEMVARGVRSTRALQEALGVDQRTIRYYTQAGAWLGFLEPTSEPRLTPEGLAYVYAGPARPALWSDAVKRQPFLARLLDRSPPTGPSRDAIVRAILEADPDLAPSTVERRVSSVRGLLGPHLDHVAANLPDDEVADPNQLALPLAQAPRVEPTPPLTATAGRAFSPDIYRYLLCFLLDHGELTLGHVRGLLDRAGAADVPLGTYVELALDRGDAVRTAERLVVTPEAVGRRDFAASTSAVILSDGAWRAQLDALRAGTESPDAGRWRLWNRRLLGKDATPDTLDALLADVLRDRGLASWPRTTGRSAFAPEARDATFLDSLDGGDLVVALPPALAQLWEGVAGLNRRLRNARHRADAVGTPTAAYRPGLVHGGLLSPGELLPRAIPDARTLRNRVVRSAPYPAMVVALLLLHRNHDPAVDVRQVHGTWQVRRHGKRLGELLPVLDGFVAAQGWVASRRPHGGLGATTFVGLLERLGLVVTVRDRLVLDDTFFHRLRDDDEGALLGTGLAALGDRLGGWLDHLRAVGDAA